LTLQALSASIFETPDGQISLRRVELSRRNQLK
jgi:hypothetical protein